MSFLFAVIGRAILNLFSALYYQLLEYLVIILPFVLVSFLPIPMLGKTVIYLILLAASIRFYYKWRKSQRKKRLSKRGHQHGLAPKMNATHKE